MDIYIKVKSLADAKNLSITDLEKQCALGNGAIIKWKTSMPKADSLFKVATALDVPIECFLSEEGLELPNPHFAEESELLLNYRKLDGRRKHKLHLFLYDEIEAMKNKEQHPPQRIPFAASGEADITPAQDALIQEKLHELEAQFKDLKGG